MNSRPYGLKLASYNRWSPIIVRACINAILLMVNVLFAQISFLFLPTKALTKQEGPNICWDARFWHFFFLILISCLLQKKTCKKQASQQTFGPSHFDRALVCNSFGHIYVFLRQHKYMGSWKLLSTASPSPQ